MPAHRFATFNIVLLAVLAGEAIIKQAVAAMKPFPVSFMIGGCPENEADECP